MHPGDLVPSGSVDRLSEPGTRELPIFCRRDDYAFLPQNALGGLPCVATPAEQRIDPYQLAVGLEASLPPPALRIRMNPELGMVAVPTWFWVEGYDGGDLGGSQTMLVLDTECHFRPVRDDNSDAVIEPDLRPRLERVCETHSTTFTVQVRLWPNHYFWDFGDDHSRELSCSLATCRDALGQMYSDPRHPSPIQHPYVWTSLGKSGIDGEQDTYRIGLGITFAAAFRVDVNGNGVGGWQGLPERQLTWSANHQVQEAQAVLSRP
jgi:hypothetical protein